MAAAAVTAFCFVCFALCVFAKKHHHKDDMLSLWRETFHGDHRKNGRDPHEAREKIPPRNEYLLDTSSAQFAVKVEDMTETNATIVFTASEAFDREVLRYAVIYWPERRPEKWNERFSGVDDDKNHVLVNELRPGRQYRVRVSALLDDGTNNHVEANFSTPGRPGHDEFNANVSTAGDSNRPSTDLLNPSSDTCLMSITKRKSVNGSLYLKWTRQTCSGRKTERFAIIYRSSHDYRRVYTGINQTDIVIRGLIEEPYDVRVEALPMDLAPSLGNIETVSTREDTTTTTTKYATEGLLISVIILSVLFVSSGGVAVYLCFYLRIHQHQTTQKRSLPEDKMTELPRIMKTGNESETMSTSEKGVILERSVMSDSHSAQTDAVEDPLRVTRL